MHRLPHLRYITNAAAALPLGRCGGCGGVFPHAEIFLMYGLTECQRASYLPPGLIDQCPDSVGVPIPGTSVQVVDEDGRPVGPGIVGELVVRGPHVMKGYWNDAEATAQVLQPDGESGDMLLHTGDLFRTGANRLLYFVERRGRRDQGARRKGCTATDRGSDRAASRRRRGVRLRRPRRRGGRSDRGGGQAVRRRRADGRRRSGVIATHSLEPFMVPKVVDVRATLPTTTSGKVSRRALRLLTAATRRISGMSTVTAFSADLLRIDARGRRERAARRFLRRHRVLPTAPERPRRRPVRRDRQQRRRRAALRGRSAPSASSA